VSFEPPECQACGACCFASNPGHVPVTGEDYARLTAAEQRDLVVVRRGNKLFLRAEGGRCANLIESEGGFACAIYERRPAVCRALERGSPACRYEHGRIYGG
jgi:Fe-S-cluster containining protein